MYERAARPAPTRPRRLAALFGHGGPSRRAACAPPQPPCVCATVPHRGCAGEVGGPFGWGGTPGGAVRAPGVPPCVFAAPRRVRRGAAPGARACACVRAPCFAAPRARVGADAAAAQLPMYMYGLLLHAPCDIPAPMWHSCTPRVSERAGRERWSVGGRCRGWRSAAGKQVRRVCVRASAAGGTRGRARVPRSARARVLCPHPPVV